MKFLKHVWNYLIDLAEIIAESKRKTNGYKGYY